MCSSEAGGVNRVSLKSALGGRKKPSQVVKYNLLGSVSAHNIGLTCL